MNVLRVLAMRVCRSVTTAGLSLTTRSIPSGLISNDKHGGKINDVCKRLFSIGKTVLTAVNGVVAACRYG
jgi:hypothetical protein